MADTTSLAESSQAFLCAIGDYMGKMKTNKIFDIEKYPIYEDFWNQIPWRTYDAAAKRIKTPPISTDDIDKFLTENVGWYHSSVKVAKKLVNDITDIDADFNIAGTGFQSLYYFRGDEEVMGNMADLFKIANANIRSMPGQIRFGDVNKWNPADIYLASKKAKKDIKNALANAKPGKFRFSSLNILTSDLIDTGDLLPLSLKKSTKTVHLHKINFDTPAELEKLKKLSIDRSKPTTDWKPYKIVPYGQKSETRDMRIFLNNDGELKIRHDPSSQRIVVEFIGSGAEARAGSIGSIKTFTELLKLINPNLATSILTKYRSGETKFKAAMKQPNMVAFKKQRDATKSKADKERYDFERGSVSAFYVINNIMPALKKFFNEVDNPEVNDFIQLLYAYVTSRSPLSGKFVIAK